MATLWRNRLREFEKPIVYALTLFSSAVGVFVYGATKINSGRAAGLLADLKPLFGVPYALAVGAVLCSLLVALRQWKGLLVVAAVYGLMFGLEVRAAGTGPLAWDEYLALSAMLACLLTAGLLRKELLD